MTNKKNVNTKLNLNMITKLKPVKEWILLDDNPLLRQTSQPLTVIEPNDLIIIEKMINYIDACYLGLDSNSDIRPGLAVAAPQMGLLKRVIYIHLNDHDIEHRYLLANPEIISRSQALGFVNSGEGCLSVPIDIKGNIARNYKIIVKAIDLFSGNEIQISATNLLSVCLQHEIDHLDGILYTDRINQKNPFYIDPKWFVIE